MRERPILFSGHLVRAILAGTKTVTRRPVRRENKPAPGSTWAECLCREIDPSDTPCVVCDARFGACPFGETGDRLWVRETWGPRAGGVVFRADEGNDPPDGSRWRPSIHMPRWASRIVLEVTGVRVERLQDITEEDAKAEGVTPFFEVDLATFVHGRGAGGLGATHRKGFARAWDEIYGAGSWAASPWVWRVAFRRLDPR